MSPVGVTGLWIKGATAGRKGGGNSGTAGGGERGISDFGNGTVVSDEMSTVS